MHKFWSSQPVRNEESKIVEPIEIISEENLNKNQYALPKGYEWIDCDLTDKNTISKLQKFLSENYVEGNDFHLSYSTEFLQWALLTPGYIPALHTGVMNNGILVGFISATPSTIKSFDTIQRMVEVNFMCVHKKLRSKKLATILVKESARRSYLHGMQQAVCTSSVVLLKPIANINYYHRYLNPKKLIDSGFATLPRNVTLSMINKLYLIRNVDGMGKPADDSKFNLRFMTIDDVPSVFKLYCENIKKYDLARVLNINEFKHYFLPRKGVIKTYINDTEMISIYDLPYVKVSDKYVIYAAYLYYYITNDLNKLLSNLLPLIKNDYDVFNMIGVMNNESVVKSMKFILGNAKTYYYFYNWKSPNISSEKIGMIIV
jgi:glycylpeptide N-tetradecanoyltransferase